MQFAENTLWVISIAIFASVAGLVYLMGSLLTQRQAVRQRLGTGGSTIAGGAPTFIDTVRSKIDIDQLIDQQTRSRQRFELIQAGYFGSNAVRAYNLIRFALVIVAPAVGFMLIANKLHTWSNTSKTIFMIGAIASAYYLPGMYIDRRRRSLQTEYRFAFPDFLDLLVVCVEAGLSLEAALERVAKDIGTANRQIGINLAIMGAEVRAGLGTIEGFRRFADRLGLEEAKSLAMLLQQSLELGTDISQALTTFSDEMRDKRLARAEEKAHQLPVKLTMPLILFIFPTILIVALGPVLLKLLPLMRSLGN